MKSLFEKKITSLFLIILILFPAVSVAFEFPLPVSLLTEDYTAPIRVLVYEPEVRMLSQFDDPRIEQLNRVIRHLSIDMTIDHELSRTAIFVDQDEVYFCLQKEIGEEKQKIYSFEPYTVFTEKQDAEDHGKYGLTGFLEEHLLKTNCDLEDFHALFNTIPEAFAERVRSEKTDLRFSGFGKAVQKVTVSFPADYVKENFPGLLANRLQLSSNRDFISGMMFSGSQKIGLMYNESGEIVRITYDGKAGKTPESIRKVSLVWKCLHEDDHVKDNITLKTPAISGNDKDNIIINRDFNLTDPSSNIYQWDISLDNKSGKENRKQTHFNAELKETDSVISGNIEYTVKQDNTNRILIICPEIREETAGEYRGTLEIADYSGKIEKNRLLFHLLIEKVEPLNWPETEVVEHEAETILSDVNAGSKERKSIEDTIAGLIIQKLFSLPEAELEYFSHEIPTSMWYDINN